MSTSSKVQDLMEKGLPVAIGGQVSDSILVTDSASRETPTTPTPPQGTHSVEAEGLSTRQWSQRIRKPFAKFRKTTKPQAQQKIPRQKTRVRHFAKCPKGYPRLAAFLDSDENFMLYRRFGFLQARLLLHKQDELRELEEELDIMDSADEKQRPMILKCRDIDDAKFKERKKLLTKIEMKFREYAGLLLTSRDLADFKRPPASDYWSVRSYFDEAAPLVSDECYIYHKEDIVTLKPGRETAWLDAFLEKMLTKFFCRLIELLFCSQEFIEKADRKNTRIILYCRERIAVVINLVITAMLLVLLIVPVWLLWRLTRVTALSEKRMAVIIGVLLVFTLGFSATVSLFTPAKRQEILASAAAYCAVLVVFIGNVGQSPPTGSG